MQILMSFLSLLSKLGFKNIKNQEYIQSFPFYADSDKEIKSLFESWKVYAESESQSDPVIRSFHKNMQKNIDIILRNISSDVMNNENIIEKKIDLPKDENLYYGSVSGTGKLNGSLVTIIKSIEHFPCYFNNYDNYVVVNATYTDDSHKTKYFKINFKIVKLDYINDVIKEHFSNCLDFI